MQKQYVCWLNSVYFLSKNISFAGSILFWQVKSNFLLVNLGENPTFRPKIQKNNPIKSHLSTASRDSARGRDSAGAPWRRLQKALIGLVAPQGRGGWHHLSQGFSGWFKQQKWLYIYIFIFIIVYIYINYKYINKYIYIYI